MHISKVKTAIKIGNFILRNDDHRNHISFEYSNTNERLLNSNDGRVYIFTSNNIIKKIGGSVAQGGIKATINPYITSMTGSPGAPRFIIHLLIRDLLKKDEKVECYMVTSPNARAFVSGLFDQVEMNIASFTEMERRCKEDYKKIEGRYPDWNYKENSDPYPTIYAQMHNEYHSNRLEK